MSHVTSNENSVQAESEAPAASENPAEETETPAVVSQSTADGTGTDAFIDWTTNKSPVLGGMQKELQALRAKMTEERRRIKHERSDRKERVRVLCILGKIIANGGKDRVAQALSKAPWLAKAERLIVEYHYELRPRPVVKRQKATEGH